MKKRILAAILSFMLICSFMPAALADESNDTTPPHLLGVTINATAFASTDTLNVTVTTDEAEDGFNFSDPFHHCIIDFLNIDPNDPTHCIDGFGAELNTEIAPGVLQVSVPLGQKVGGTYRLYSIILCDKDGNTSSYFANYQDAPGATGPVPDVSFTLNSDYQKPPSPPDPVPNALKKFTLSKYTANVGDTITYTITASDPSILSMTMDVVPMGVPWYYRCRHYPVILAPVSGKPGVFIGRFKITADMPQGDYYPCNVVLTPASGAKITVDWPFNYGYYPGGVVHLGNVILKVINPALTPTDGDLPIITSFSISNHQLIQGQTATVTATLDSKSPPFSRLRFTLQSTDNSNGDINLLGDLSYQGGHTYSGTIQIPLNLRHGHYVFCGPCLFLASGDAGEAAISPSLQAVAQDDAHDSITYIKGSEITVVSAVSISGAANKTLLVGSDFDPMQGVSARNAYTGDITDKIKVTGSVDTINPGVYLLKYEATDDVPVNGSATPFTYTDYRWIGVSEVEPDAPAANGQTPLAVTDGQMAVGAASKDATLKKDGRTIAFSSKLTSPGVYTAASGGNSATAVIDRAGPTMKAAWAKTASGISVRLQASDVSGVAKIKYLVGACTLDQCRAGGKAYAGAFTIPAYGKYTVYAQDKLGNESLKVIDIISATTDAAHLSSIGLSAGALSKKFAKTVYSYTVKLGENAGSVTIKPVAEWDGAVVTIGGRVASSSTVAVANGKSVKVTIKVAYGKFSHTYKLTVTRAKSTDNRLKALTATSGAFNTPFDPAVTKYTLTLGEGVKSVKLKAPAASPLARASPAAKTVVLNPGQSKVVKITVRAQSGAARTYTVTVVRAKCTDASLKFIKTSPAGLLTPAFRPAVKDYAITLPASKSAVTLTFAAKGYKAAVLIDGARKTTKKLTLQPRQTVVVHVVVVAQAGNRQEYDITVRRP